MTRSLLMFALMATASLAGCGKEDAGTVGGETHPFQIRLVVETPAGKEATDPFPDPHAAAGQVMHVDRAVLMHEGHVDSAMPMTDERGKRIVIIRFTDEGSALLKEITRRHTDRRIALILDGKVLIAPVIRGEMEGSAVIDGGATELTAEEQRQLILGLNDAPRRLRGATTAPAAATQPSSHDTEAK